MKLILLLTLTACGASTPNESAQQPAKDTASTTAVSTTTTTASTPTTIDKPIPSSSLVVTIPANAVFKKIGDSTEPDVEIDIAGEKGPALLVQGNEFGMLYGDLDTRLENMKEHNQSVVSKTGTTKDYTLVIKPYAEQAIVNYARRFSAGGKDMACSVLSIPEGAQDLLKQYDAICKSVRAKP